MEQAVGCVAEGQEQRAITIGRKILNDGLNSMYKVFLKVGSPVWVLNRSPGLWKSYFKGSELTILSVEDGRSKLSVTDYGPTNLAYCYAQLGGMIESLHLAGAKEIRGTHTACRRNRSEKCLFELTWS